MKTIKETVTKPSRPARIAQFGQGNFLRAFADMMIDKANEAGVFDGSVEIFQFHGAEHPAFAEQDCLYTVVTRGREEGKVVDTSRVVTAVRVLRHLPEARDAFSACAAEATLTTILSNTTEAGIAWDGEARPGAENGNLPAYLTSFLYLRYRATDGDADMAPVVLPCELIEDNGRILQGLVLRYAAEWELSDGFSDWVKNACVFCNTLVDRIVTGYPKDGAASFAETLGYEDRLLTVCEPFALWVIETDRPERVRAALPLEDAGLPVVITDDVNPYRTRKVRILNGAHTSFVPAALLAGEEIVRDCMHAPLIRPFIEQCVYKEIIPAMSHILPAEELDAFADAVLERFDNPYIDHALWSIALNSVSKWKTRVLPSVMDSVKNGVVHDGLVPRGLCLSFAALCRLYALHADDGVLRDDGAVLAFFAEHKEDSDLPDRFASEAAFWGMDLHEIPSFAECAAELYRIILENGIGAAIKAVI